MKEEIKIVPSPRLDWCGVCKMEHGYDCPNDTPTEPVDKCTECQFEKGHSQGCSEYIAGKPFESTEPVCCSKPMRKWYSQQVFTGYVCDECRKELPPTEPVTEDWEKEFDNLWHNGFADAMLTHADEFNFEEPMLYPVKKYAEIKDFISLIVRQTRLDLLNEIDEVIKYSSTTEETLGFGLREEQARTQVRADLLAKYKTKGLQVGVDIINKHKK